MTKKYEYILSRNLHKTRIDRQSDKEYLMVDEVAFVGSLDEAKSIAGSDVSWDAPLLLPKPAWAESGPWGIVEWLPEYHHASTDKEWLIYQHCVEA